MLMVHSVMMMVSLLLGVMLGVVLAASVRRVSVVNHVDAVARWLASPDLGDAALGDTHLLAAALMVTRRQAGRAVTRRLPRHRRRRLGRRLLVVVPRRIFQSHVITFVVDVHGECDAMMGHQLHGGADRRHRGGRIELHQGGLQLQSVHLQQENARRSPLYQSALNVTARSYRSSLE